MTRDEFRRAYLKLHNSYERKAFSVLKRDFKQLLEPLTANTTTQGNYIGILNTNISNADVEKMLFNLYYEIGLLHKNIIDKSIQDDETLKRWNVLFNDTFAKAVATWLADFGGLNIVSIRGTLIGWVVQYIRDAVLAGENFREASKKIYEGFGETKPLYKWQLYRIARTETTGASNFATLQSMQDSPLLIDKVWISAIDERTRETHRDIDGEVLPLEQMFKMPNNDGDIDSLLFPGDQNGSAENVINCRCAIAPKVRRGPNGLPILK